MPQTKILPTITTLPPIDKCNTWQEKIQEAQDLELKEASLFVTGLNYQDRQECYKLLEGTFVEKIPLVHLRNDVTIEELDYLTEKFNTEVFNTHPIRERPLMYDWSRYQDKIYIENTKYIPEREELERFGGICLDFVHWENALLKEYSNYKPLSDLVQKYPIGCGHLSPLKPSIEENPESNTDYDSHYMEKLSEFDYLQKYLNYLPPFVAIEVKNSLKKQLQIKQYVESNILDL